MKADFAYRYYDAAAQDVTVLDESAGKMDEDEDDQSQDDGADDIAVEQ